MNFCKSVNLINNQKQFPCTEYHSLPSYSVFYQGYFEEPTTLDTHLQWQCKEKWSCDDGTNKWHTMQQESHKKSPKISPDKRQEKPQNLLSSSLSSRLLHLGGSSVRALWKSSDFLPKTRLHYEFYISIDSNLLKYRLLPEWQSPPWLDLFISERCIN